MHAVHVLAKDHPHTYACIAAADDHIHLPSTTRLNPAGLRVRHRVYPHMHWCRPCRSMVAMQAQRLAPTPAAAPPLHPAPQLPPAPSQSQLSAEWLHAAMAAAAAGAPPPSTCPGASSAHTSPQKLRHAACYAVCDGEFAVEEAVACHVPGGASEDWPGGAAWDGAWTAVEGVDGPAVVQWAQQLLEAQPSGEMPQQVKPLASVLHAIVHPG